MRIATIDLGTNTALLLIADILSNGAIQVLCDELRSPRMGKDVDEQRKISEQSFLRVKEIFLEYKEIISRFDVEKIVATGTSALRDASNREEFISQIKSETGITIEMLSGEDEAQWTFRGAISGMKNLSEKITVIDIGGGSTEWSVAESKEQKAESNAIVETSAVRYVLRFSKSVNVGAVRISEKFFSSLPPNESECARKFILQQIAEIQQQQFSYSQLIGVAGTVTTLAALAQRLPQFEREKIANYVLTLEEIENLFHFLSLKSAEEIHALSDTTHGREDILTAGTLILITIMKYFGWEKITASVRGLRYGIALREWEKLK
ncbi:MAG: Ppx/GppA family phosphatase [Bacteroidota bacterium]